MAQLSKSKIKGGDISDEESGPKPAKIRNIESPGLNGMENSSSSKPLPIFKDLRVKVERLSTEGRSDMQSTSGEVEDKPKTSTSRTNSEERKSTPGSRKTSEERQVRKNSMGRLAFAS